LGLSDTQFQTLLSILYVGYILFQGKYSDADEENKADGLLSPFKHVAQPGRTSFNLPSDRHVDRKSINPMALDKLTG
jgi:hypothetical protein